MPARCCRGQTARPSSGSSWPGYAAIAHRPDFSSSLSSSGIKSAIRFGGNEAIGRGSCLARSVWPPGPARQNGPTNLRIDLATLSISRPYLRTIEPSRSIALALPLLLKAIASPATAQSTTSLPGEAAYASRSVPPTRGTFWRTTTAPRDVRPRPGGYSSEMTCVRTSGG